MIVLLSLACTSSPPPGPKPEPAPVEEPEPAPQPVTINLTPSQGWGGETVIGRTWAEIEKTPEMVGHPEGAKLGAYVVTPYGDKYLAVALDGVGKGTWTVSADLNGDRKVRAAEFVELGGEDNPSATLRTVMKRGRPTADLPITLEVRSAEIDGTTTFTHRIEASRLGEIPCDDCEPAGPIAVHIGTWGGVFDSPRTRITVDDDGDGRADLEDLTHSFAGDSGVLEARGKRWSYAVAGDGNTLTVTRVGADTALAGIRRGSAAPDFKVTTHDGEERTLASYSGKPLVLAFGSRVCLDCVSAEADLEAFAKDQGAELLGISSDSGPAAPPGRRGRRAPTPKWPTAYLGIGNEVAAAYGIGREPAYAWVDADGQIVALGSLAVLKATAKEAAPAEEVTPPPAP